jgi:hypothetical protein
MPSEKTPSFVDKRRLSRKGRRLFGKDTVLFGKDTVPFG